jgi:tetratricopeptide (TPR) repeat protein
MRALATFCFTCLLLAGVPLQAQSAAGLIARGDSLNPLLHPDSALVFYREALVVDSGSYEVLWRMGRGFVDVAKQMRPADDSTRARRDSLYALAADFGRRAIRADSLAPEGHFVLALALGRLARTRGSKDRIRFARLIYDEAALALKLRPDHDGAEHILGAWHWEAQRLSGRNKFLAKVFLGGGFLNRAKRDSAVVHLSRAVVLNPGYAYHRLGLADVLIGLGRRDEAVAQLDTTLKLPDSDVLDPDNRRRAAETLERLRKDRR